MERATGRMRKAGVICEHALLVISSNLVLALKSKPCVMKCPAALSRQCLFLAPNSGILSLAHEDVRTPDCPLSGPLTRHRWTRVDACEARSKTSPTSAAPHTKPAPSQARRTASGASPSSARLSLEGRPSCRESRPWRGAACRRARRIGRRSEGGRLEVGEENKTTRLQVRRCEEGKMFRASGGSENAESCVYAAHLDREKLLSRKLSSLR